LDIDLIDDLLEECLALEQRQLPQVVAVEIKQIEGDHHDLFRSPLEFVLQHREIRGAIYCRDHSLAVDDRGPGVNVPGVGGDLSETVGPVVAASGEHFDRSVPEMDLDPIAISDLAQPAFAAWHLVDRRCQSRFDEAGKGRRDGFERVFRPIYTNSQCNTTLRNLSTEATRFNRSWLPL